MGYLHNGDEISKRHVSSDVWEMNVMQARSKFVFIGLMLVQASQTTTTLTHRGAGWVERSETHQSSSRDN
jgi:hypothetical protein